ncbi:MAG: Gfo/Idh/MocA family oxidoreductase, partial [Promethearchaeota archaeon]
MKLNIGFIGTGSIALLHLLSLKKIKEENLLEKYSTTFEIKGVADINENTLNNLKKKNPYDIKYFTTDPNEIINDKDINIVYITTPTRFHEEYYIK